MAVTRVTTELHAWIPPTQSFSVPDSVNAVPKVKAREGGEDTRRPNPAGFRYDPLNSTRRHVPRNTQSVTFYVRAAQGVSPASFTPFIYEWDSTSVAIVGSLVYAGVATPMPSLPSTPGGPFGALTATFDNAAALNPAKCVRWLRGREGPLGEWRGWT